AISTPYINTIPVHQQPEYPGDIEIEKTISSLVRWNAMAMVVNANRDHDGIGGHISTYASCATLYEVGFNHFFKGNNGKHEADQIFFQGHASPGNYARSYLEGRFTDKQLHNFRQELGKSKGLSSYPHPYLMPNYWQFPTVSMGLGPLGAIYQAQFNRYLKARNIIKNDPKVWCFVGDGESDEPETLGALSLAARENLDNLIFVVNCNLQRLDGPVRGNGKIIQELESIFKGAGWHAIKVIWGSDWDGLLQSPQRDLLMKRMADAVDGEYQKYTVSPGSYARKHFFNTPELKKLVNHLTDNQLTRMLRGGHDPKKVYTAYHEAVNHKGGPVVILAKTIKGYGLGEAGEGKNISHQQKKLNEKELREFKKRFNIPISDDDVVEAPFFRPSKNSKEMKYLHKQRQKLGGYLPERKPNAPPLPIPKDDFFKEFLSDSGEHSLSTTMGFVRIMSKLLRDPSIGKNIVPIIPDEGRTFGMEALFRQIGIYSSKGQLYEPVDSETLLYYKEAKDGQMLESGINEAGSMASFISAGTTYATHGIHMIPFYIYYSMFGFQRIGDQMWLAGDIGAKGFLLGGTAGRTTLNGEGLQHQDGHSHLLASTIPNLLAYDCAFRYEISIVVQDGLNRMYVQNETLFYYLTLSNENYKMPTMPKGSKEGILKGLYKFEKGSKGKSHQVHIFGSGTILREAIKAKEILEDKYDCSVTIWSATNYKRLRSEALAVRRHNMLNPTKPKQKSYIESILEKETGHFISVSDNMKMVADQINPWVPGGLFSLGTDGFGRSDTRENLRRFFEVDAACIVVGTLYWLSEKGELPTKTVSQAIKELKVNPKKAHPIVL
ncbi:MAG: pyruvate dehydrogenase (acetyl-transferring), homodimeric type, partial [Candidatus Margulisbacteria bacterium]|nr:pyruvate dehydrogenase (acetyl-transferring), homodimeric type [Candidatus Margulisiibacteriota bacterium]